jgi:hypothetical protein
MTSLNIKDLEKLIEEIEAKKPKPEDNLIAIVITKYAPAKDMAKVMAKDGFYFLVQKEIWLKDFEIHFKKVNDTLMFSGIPIYEDDELAIKLLLYASDAMGWKYMGYTWVDRRPYILTGS